jgi:hypothetical protein
MLLHSITSSARPSSGVGTVIPKASRGALLANVVPSREGALQCRRRADVE